jgi:hypothetical protein
MRVPKRSLAEKNSHDFSIPEKLQVCEIMPQKSPRKFDAVE